MWIEIWFRCGLVTKARETQWGATKGVTGVGHQVGLHFKKQRDGRNLGKGNTRDL
jgi:hypothetical protein